MTFHEIGENLEQYFIEIIQEKRRSSFDRITYEPLKPYYAFYAFSDLADLGTQVKTTAEGEGIYALAAKSADGKHGALLLTNYRNEFSLDGKEFPPEEVKLSWNGLSDGPLRVTVRTLDNERDLEKTDERTIADGALTLTLPLFGTVVVNFDAE